MSNCSVSVVIPAYNEATSIGAVVEEAFLYSDEVIVVDDASSDRTPERAREAGAEVIRQSTNRGYIPAIKQGFQHAAGEVVATVDADGEMPLEKLPELIEPVCREQADMVQGRRSKVPRPSERFISWLASFLGPVGDSGTGFRALRTDLAQELALQGACICGIFALEVLANGGKIAEVDIQLRDSPRPKNIAWYHGKQTLYVSRWYFRRREVLQGEYVELGS